MVAGASGGIGQVIENIKNCTTCADKVSQPLSLLLKSSPLIDELSLYDVVNTPGVAADLSHISTRAVSFSSAA